MTEDLATTGRDALARTRGEVFELRLPYDRDPADVFLRVLADEPMSFWFEGGLAGADAVMGMPSPRSAAAVGAATGRTWTFGPDAEQRHHDGLIHELLTGLQPSVATDNMPFGWVGWIGYDSACEFAGLPSHRSTRPDSAMFIADRTIRFNRESGEIEIRTIAGDSEWAETAARKLAQQTHVLEQSDPTSLSIERGLDENSYRARFDSVQARIRDGDLYVMCLTDRLTSDVQVRPIDAFVRLRQLSRAPQRGFIRVYDNALVSASTEVFLAIEGTQVASRPVKGTRARQPTPEADEAARRQLGDDPKELAENTMIVDLLRNDLSRVCDAGSVHVPVLCEVETLPHVHQLVSTVEGRIRASTRLIDVLAALLPAGSMTGAPKHSAVESILDLEQSLRGAYAGAFGWFGDGSDTRLAMTIRTVMFDGTRASIGSGGGITSSSDPDAEWDELNFKAAPLIAVLDPDFD